MARAAYVTDLKTLQGECSANYLRLLRLVGDMESGQRRDIALHSDHQHFGDLHLAILQEAPYTRSDPERAAGRSDRRPAHARTSLP